MVPSTWVQGVADDDPFGLATLAYGVVAPPGGKAALVVRIGDQALLLAPAMPTVLPGLAPLVRQPSLDALLATDAATWRRLRQALVVALSDEWFRPRLEPFLVPIAGLEPRLAFSVADYVDFYASEHHATNVGRLFRPGTPPLPEAWKHLPIGYHGRAGTVVVSGTPVRRPVGLRREADGGVAPGASRRLDLEAEIGFVLGGPTRLGEPVAMDEAASHIFGVVVVNDWSARDIQAFEYVPLGPFGGKSFATSVSAWVVPFEALEAARVAPPPRDPPLASYLDDRGRLGGIDLELQVELNGAVVSTPPYAAMYWTPEQMVAHLTVNGASLRAGDLIASGTVSGPADGEVGSLLELTAGGTAPLSLPGGERSFLEDGDTVQISAAVRPAPGRRPVALGAVIGEVLPARGA